jgi:hypothetical protein
MLILFPTCVSLIHNEWEFRLKIKIPQQGLANSNWASNIGPFRIIKAHPASQVVIPWTENFRLEKYYKDPDIMRYLEAV